MASSLCIVSLESPQTRLREGLPYAFALQQGQVNFTLLSLPGDRVRVAITGTDAPPTAEVRSEAQQLVLGVAIKNAADVGEEEAIELVVTGEQEEDYFVPDASTATRIDTPILDVPASIQVIPRQVLDDQQVTDIVEALGNVSGVSADSDRGIFTDVSIRGFTGALLRL